MKKRKLNYRFHNPNSIEATADYLMKLFVKVNEPKVERAIQEYVEQVSLEQEERKAG